MRHDPIERLRAANPLHDGPSPSIDDVWRRLEQRGETADPPRSAVRPRRIGGSALLAVLTAIAIIVAVGALSALHHRRQNIPSHPGAVHHGVEGSRSQLRRLLTALRRPQDATDRSELRVPRLGGLLPHYLSDEQMPFGRSHYDVTLERGLARSFVIPGSRYRAAVFPVAATRGGGGIARGQQAVVLSVMGPRMGVSHSGAVAAGWGTPAASAPVSVSGLRADGVAVSFSVDGSADINRLAILVPDGVTAISLRDITLTSPSTGERLARLPTEAAPVRANVALFTFTDMTASRLRVSRDPDKGEGGFRSGRGCTLTKLIYDVLGTAVRRDERPPRWGFHHIRRWMPARFRWRAMRPGDPAGRDRGDRAA